jgi:putative transposase
MTDQEREEVALFRFGVISDLVGATRLDHGERGRLIKQKAAAALEHSAFPRTRISDNTIRRWVAMYEKSGRQLDSLKPVPRSDIGALPPGG